MDDDLMETQSLTHDQIGSIPDGALGEEVGGGPDPRADDQSWTTRIKRGSRIALTGKHKGVRYHWRDRLTIFGRALVVKIALLALSSFVLDIIGVDSGPIDTAEKATRETILTLYAHGADFGMVMLNNPLITLAVALLAAVVLWREEM